MASREVKTAVEVPGNRRWSSVGTVQRHYHLTPALPVENGAPVHGVVTVPAGERTYVFPAESCGSIADYRKIASVPGVDDPAKALEALGYTVSSNDTDSVEGEDDED